MHKTILLFIVPLLLACEEQDEKLVPGKLTLHFDHLISGQAIHFDSLMYTNAAGNAYEINEIQWFISDIILVNSQNEELFFGSEAIAHYIDTDLPETWVWSLPDEIPPDNYTLIKITFGIRGEKNTPYAFPNSPESDMQWPYQLGGDFGGYHYMKLNGFWIDSSDERTPFNFHLGVGQEYDSDGNVTRYIQNWFETELPQSSFTLQQGEHIEMTIEMNVENWFQSPHVYDHNIHGGKIMKNQTAMGMICENGQDVFTIKMPDKNEKTGL